MSRPKRTAKSKQAPAPHRAAAASKRRVRKGKAAALATPGKPAPVLDTSAYPHLLDEIIVHAPYEVLLALRETSRAVRRRVDRSLYRHIILTREDQHLPPTIADDIDEDALIVVSAPDRAWETGECLPGFPPTEVYEYLELMEGLEEHEARSAATGPTTRARAAAQEVRDEEDEEYAHQKAYLAHTKIVDVHTTHGAYVAWLSHLHPEPFGVVREFCGNEGFYQTNPVLLAHTLVVMPQTQPSSMPMPEQETTLRYFPRATRRVVQHVKMPLSAEDPVIAFHRVPIVLPRDGPDPPPGQQVFVFSDASPNLVPEAVERAKRVLAELAGKSPMRRWHFLAADLAPALLTGEKVLIVDFDTIDNDWFQFDAELTPAQRQESLRLRLLGELLGDSEISELEPVGSESEALALLDANLAFSTRAEWEAGLTAEEVELFAVDALVSCAGAVLHDCELTNKAKRELDTARETQSRDPRVVDIIIASIDLDSDEAQATTEALIQQGPPSDGGWDGGWDSDLEM